MILLIFLFGICIGSFLNVLIDRMPRKESIVGKRSHCETCYHTLSWNDLFPLFSFLLLKGKCRYCRSSIGWQYFLIELSTGILFVVTSIFISLDRYSNGVLYAVDLSFYLFIISCLIVIFATDVKYGIIPDAVLFPATIITLLHLLFLEKDMFITHIAAGAGAFIFFFILFAITRGRGMGFGDVKLVFFLGLLLGILKTIVALYIAFLTGAMIALILVLSKKKKFYGGTLPFGPFLVFGTVLSLFCNTVILHNMLLLWF